MRILIHAVGRLKAGPERDLSERYLDRFAKAGPAVGLDLAGVSEVPESRARNPEQRMREEAEKLLALAQDVVVIILDERGKSLSSDAFTQFLSRNADAGRRDCVIAIGGADGHDPAIRDRADLVISFGAATWPHQMVRFMLAEQLYRAATILSGHPYHRA